MHPLFMVSVLVYNSTYKLESGIILIICPLLLGAANNRAYSCNIVYHAGAVQVYVEPDVPDSLLLLRVDYATMLLELKTANLCEENLKNLKEFLSALCEENAINDCSTLKQVIDCLIEKFKICAFNIETLGMCSCCEKVNFSEVSGPVKQYGKQLKKFLSETSVQKLKDSVQSEVTSLEDVESLTLKLDDKRHDDTLESLKQLTYHCFGVNSKAFILFKIHKGCVSITWFVPTSLVPTLRETAEQHSPKFFASLGVLKVVVGQQVVYNNNEG